MRGCEWKFNGHTIYFAPGWEFTNEELDVISYLAVSQKEKLGNVTNKVIKASIKRRDGGYDTIKFSMTTREKEIWLFFF